MIATTSGPTADAARSHLHDLDWRSTSPTTMVLARIDREEPHYAAIAAELLQRYGFTVDIDPPSRKRSTPHGTGTTTPTPGAPDRKPAR